MPENNEMRPYQSPRYWDDLAADFDDEPDHGLRDPAIRAAWSENLAHWLPSGRLSILDAGCGTGSLSLLLAEAGHRVTGIDWSEAMIAGARAKIDKAGLAARFLAMDAADPDLPSGQFDVVLFRHLLWAMPKPAQVLERWSRLLAPGGGLVLIEGFWHTGGGLHVEELIAALPPSMASVQVHDLSQLSHLWGGQVTDERYVVIALTPPRPFSLLETP